MKKYIKLLIPLFVVLIVVLCFSFSGKSSIPTNTIPELEPDKMDEALLNEYENNKKINEDYIGKIKIGNLINLPFVQATTLFNKQGEPYTFYDMNGYQITDMKYGCDEGPCDPNFVYLWTDWKDGQYDKMEDGGSIFLDYRNSLDDQNLIIYGHHFSEPYDKERTRAFTPLEKFMDQANYEENKKITLVLDHEIREYEVAYVYEYDLNNEDGLQYYRTNYSKTIDELDDPTFFNSYIQKVKQKAYYDTGVEIKETDNTLTLQTCYSNRPDYRMITVAKEISRTKYV